MGEFQIGRLTFGAGGGGSATPMPSVIPSPSPTVQPPQSARPAPSPGMTAREMAALARELDAIAGMVAKDERMASASMGVIAGIAAGLRIRAEAAGEGE